VVVDEQHRFGVEQRDALRAKGVSPPHVLVMTATPIPRTIAMTVYGDLEVSTLSELPVGRSPIRSAVVPTAEKPAWLETAWQRVREQVAEGHQAFVVCPRIGGDEPEEPSADGRRPGVAVLDAYLLLVHGPLSGLRVEILHGRLPPDAKDAVMQRFTRGEIDVLVATTVIEVGVDVPNATVMVVLDADRFGVSQLHQLRGRIGRGSAPGLCLLVTESEEGNPSRARLDAVAATSDGFALSRVDLAQRREGDVLGASQSGTRSSLRMLRLLDHEQLILEAREEAVQLVERDPMLEQEPGLRQAVVDVLDEERADFLDKA
jgi:ATP-dependent DNA helicase RecG